MVGAPAYVKVLEVSKLVIALAVNRAKTKSQEIRRRNVEMPL